jgi:cyclopropane-fatty-acyl-phospholipid synthase
MPDTTATPQPPPTARDPFAPAVSTERTMEIVRDLFHGAEPLGVAVRLWDGTEWPAQGGASAARAVIVLNEPWALRELLVRRSEADLGELHLSGAIDVEGDIFAVLPVVRMIMSRNRRLPQLVRLASRVLRLPVRPRAGRSAGPDGSRLPEAVLQGERHSAERDRVAVTHHYDVSNRFYSLFLGRHMVYSCGIFARVDEELDSAQYRKLDTICRKLRLQPGERLLDVGCGWGSLLMHAAREYHVHAVGITLSAEQAELAHARIHAAGLDGQCTVEVRDYRTLEGEGVFDKVASVGMFEHVGADRAAEYFGTLLRLLRPGGAYLHHAVTADLHAPRKHGPTVTTRYVFPDAEPIPLGRTITLAEKAGFEVRDVESLREHYALTLRRWIASLEARRGEAVREVGEATWRAWRLVFAGAAESFEHKREGIAQVLMVRPRADGRSGLPLGRADWYTVREP